MFKAINIIENALQNDKLSHAYLFYGEPSVDVEGVVFESIKKVLKSKSNYDVDVNSIDEIKYQDLKVVTESDEGLIKKDDVNHAINSLYESNLTKDGIKILYIKDVDLGNKFSLNSLLKFIEEPVNNLVIFLSTNHFDNVISTIKSRTQNIFVKKASLIEKINEFRNIYSGDNLVLIANIFSNKKELNNINFDIFNDTTSKLMDILDKSIDNPNYFNINFSKLWNKENEMFILDILQFFFYQIQIDIDDKYPLFPNYEKLIFRYKKRNIEYFAIQKLINKTKYAIKKKGNISLQKNSFIINLIKYY